MIGIIQRLRPKSRASIFVACSATAWIVWALLRPVCHPYMDLTCGNYTDHFSHMNTARLFTEVGLDIWRRPLNEFGRPLDAEAIASFPDDVAVAAGNGARAIPGWDPDKPFVSSWGHNPRFHPPGVLILVAPVAVVYHETSLSLEGANRLLIALFLAYAHLALLVFFKAIERLASGTIGLLGALLVYGEVLHFTLEGFYEAVVIGPLILSAMAVRRGDGLAGAAWFTLAAFLHFRALFFVPLVLYSLWVVLRGKQWRKWRPRSWTVAGVTVLGGFLTLGTFALLWPHLTKIPVNNPVNLTMLSERLDVTILYVGMFLLLALALARARALFDLGVLIWLFVMFTQLRETYGWDIVSMLAWIGMPIASAMPLLVRDVRLIAILFAGAFVFNYALIPSPLWVSQLI